nr:ligase-associated DNA damage response endonuclease PdeM [Pseudomonas typographi]
MAVSVAGAELWLLAEKAVYWPAERVLLVADAHFGKAAVYRALGQPVPHGTTATNLAVLDTLLARHCCEELIFLGDFLHGRAAQGSASLDALLAWRHSQPHLRMTLIRGNHDQRAGDPPAALRMAVVDEPLLRGPLALRHEPASHPTHHVLAGHLHPVYLLRGAGRQRLRLPCFQLGRQVTLLPAFGAFTGGFAVTRKPGVQLVLASAQGVWALP